MSERKQVIVLVATKNHGDRTKTFIGFSSNISKQNLTHRWYPVDASFSDLSRDVEELLGNED